MYSTSFSCFICTFCFNLILLLNNSIAIQSTLTTTTTTTQLITENDQSYITTEIHAQHGTIHQETQFHQFRMEENLCSGFTEKNQTCTIQNQQLQVKKKKTIKEHHKTSENQRQLTIRV